LISGVVDNANGIRAVKLSIQQQELFHTGKTAPAGRFSKNALCPDR
jgi:hypothetical protein